MSNIYEFLNSLKNNSNIKQHVKPFGVTIVEYTVKNLNEVNENSGNFIFITQLILAIL